MMPTPAAIDSDMAPLPEQRAEEGGGRAQRDEHRRKARDEQHRRNHRVTPRVRLPLDRQGLQRSAREIAEIGRRQRQHAGAEKREQSCAHGGGIGNVGHAPLLNVSGRRGKSQPRRMGFRASAGLCFTAKVGSSAKGNPKAHQAGENISAPTPSLRSVRTMTLLSFTEEGSSLVARTNADVQNRHRSIPDV